MKQTIFLRTKQQQQAAINAILATPLDKDKPIPKESDVKTFNYTAHLWDIRWLRERARKTR